MKTIKILFAIFIACITTQLVSAQSGKENLKDKTKTQSIKVYGECGMCKKRIEKVSLTVDGIQSASWSEDSKMLIVKYNLFKKDAVDNLQKKVAAAGHDTEKFKATAADYQSLPDCCHYQRKQ